MALAWDRTRDLLPKTARGNKLHWNGEMLEKWRASKLELPVYMLPPVYKL